MKNKRYRELAAVLIMMTMAAGSVVTVAAEKNVETVETAEEVDVENISETSYLEVTDRFAQQTSIDEALSQEVQNGYPLEEALIVVNPYGTSPLSAVAIFSTEESCGGTVTVKGKIFGK